MRWLLPLLLIACTAPKDPIPPAKLATTNIETIDTPKDAKGQTGFWPVPLVDKTGQLMVFYCDAYLGDVRLARYEAGVWKQETVDEKGAVGKYLTGAMGEAGPELVYLDQTRKTLRYARLVSGKWSFQDIGNDKEDIGISGKFLIGPRGERSLVHYNTRNQLLLTQGVGQPDNPLVWSTRVIATAGAISDIAIGMRFDAASVLHLSYPDWTVMNAVFHAGTLAPGGELKTIDLDNDLTPGIKSALLTDGDGDDIFYATARRGLLYEARVKDGVASAHQLLTKNVANLAALKARDGRVFLALQVGQSDGLGDGALDLAVRQGETWERVGLDSTRPVGQYSALAESSPIAGVPQIHLVYYDGRLRGLRHIVVH